MTEQISSPTIKQASIKNGAILALFALISTGLIAITHLITKDKIAEEIETALARRLNEIIPANEYNNDVYHDCRLVISPELLGSSDPLKVYRMRKDNQNYAVFMTSIAPDGYSGKIKLVIGIYNSGKIAGVRVTEHSETPGLGDKIEIEKSNWIKQFDNKSFANTPENVWRVKKDGGDFDALTGATITPRAIIKAINQSLIYFDQNKVQLFETGQSCGEKNGS
ncbi:electron transport complex subunit RsxG [Aliikangiella sp. IMCC44359]|uniref:electron transport complex subunit RsxG n=1 Tax=Aliikangiella sp. IMCC44359 TaxID=3459125 RepID=UPI00403B2D3F